MATDSHRSGLPEGSRNPFRTDDHVPAGGTFRAAETPIRPLATTRTGSCTPHLHGHLGAGNFFASCSLGYPLATGRVLARSCYYEPTE
jgi:hypothetical protein